MEYPQIILLNGASSSGKTTIAKALQKAIPIPFLYYSSDLLVDANMLPQVDRSKNDSVWSWQKIRPVFFDGFHQSIRAFASAGNCIIVDHVVERKEWLDDLISLLKDFDVLYIGVFCKLEELERRELKRDRYVGEAKSHLEDGIHTWSGYDFTIDTTCGNTAESVVQIIDFINLRTNNENIFRNK